MSTLDLLVKLDIRRTHSSSMRTEHGSGHLGGRICLPVVGGERRVSAYLGVFACLWGCLPRHPLYHPLVVDRMNDSTFPNSLYAISSKHLLFWY